MLDVNDNTVTSEFIKFAKRTLHELVYDISGKNDWFVIEREVVEECLKIDKQDLVKVVLKGKYNLSLEKQVEHLDSKLNDMFFYSKIKDESVLEIRIEDYENDASLKGEFIRTVINSTLKEEEKEQVILIGLKALNGEEIE